MLWIKRTWRTAALISAAFLGGMVGTAVFQPEMPAAGVVEVRGDSPILATFGVGGVLNDQGQFWQYRPDKSSWVTLDESFALEGQATSIVPLPVTPQNIRHMETFGFIVSDEACYLYDLDSRRWLNVGMPPAGDR